MNQEQLVRKLRDKGYKITPQRRAIIDALLDHAEPPSAKEVLDSVRDRFPDMSLDTVYRNLNLLADLGVVHQINLRGKETTHFEIGGCHHHHLICLKCGRSLCMEFCLLDDRGLTAAEEQGFEVVGHAFEIYGYCQACRKVG